MYKNMIKRTAVPTPTLYLLIKIMAEINRKKGFKAIEMGTIIIRKRKKNKSNQKIKL
jgi:hypothetical protein